MERLNSLKKERNISNYRLAKNLGLNESTIRSWLKGRAIPRDDKLQMLADFFHVHPAWLKYGDKQYAPTLKDEVMRIAEELEEYAIERPQELKRLKQVIDLFMSRDIVFSKKKETKEGKRVRHKAG